MISKKVILGIVAICLAPCTPPVVREATSVVSQADSLRAEGKMYEDSAQLAQAYETFGKWKWFYADEYAHACYHYGRILREKEHPVEAMQCFINATHSRTRDYPILGRVYSNMGEIAHLASEFQLSYDLFERSAEMFMQAGDSINHYYGLYRMAFEKAELAEKDNTLSVLCYLSVLPHDERQQALLTMTYAKMYLQCQQYDSAIYFARQVSSAYYMNTTTLLLAQAYSYKGVKDSASYYAELVAKNSRSKHDLNNALYILTNDDETKDKTSIRKTSALRADIQKELEIAQGRYSQAVQLLKLDLKRKPDWGWLYAVIATMTVMGVGVIIYVYRKHKRQELLAQKLDTLQKATSTMQEKHDELAANYLNNHQHIVEEINNKCSVLRENDKIYTTLAWKNYYKMCSAVDKQFYLLASKLRNKQCLNETEIRLCVLTLLDCGYDQMAELLYRSNTSIGTLKIRVARKLGTSSKNLRHYLIDNECLK